MYIDIFLALAFCISIYVLWRRISEKIPELTLIPDQDLSVLVEENTAKLQLFFLHLFHFRSFYRERHYHGKVRLIAAKLLYKIHIAILRFDNGIIRMIKRMRSGSEATVPQSDERADLATAVRNSAGIASAVSNRIDFVPVRESMQPVSEKTNRVQEVRARKRASFAGKKTDAARATLVNDRTLLP